MGSSVSYNLETFTKNDEPIPEYLWIDQNIGKSYNQIYLESFKSSRHKVTGFGSFDAIQQRCKKLNKDQKVRIICAASCDEEVYKFIEENDQIERAVLFCAYKERANKLMRTYAKIKKACYHFEHLLLLMTQWEIQDNKGAYFCKEHEISRLYVGMINLYTIINEKEEAQPHQKSKYNDYCQRCISNCSKADIEQITKKINDGPSFVQCILVKKFVIEDINELLRTTRDPTKLEYLRWPVSQLYYQIKNRFSNAKLTHPSCFTMIMLTRDQLSRLENGNCFWLNQFIIADLKKENVKNFKDGSIFVEIKLSMGDFCNGFFEKDGKILLNVGNYFRIESYDQKKKYLIINLIAPKSQEIKIDNPESNFLLTSLRIKRLEVLQQGQWYSLMINGKKNEAESYIKDLTKNNASQNDRKNKLKWLVERTKAKYLLGEKIKLCFEEMNHELHHGQYGEKDYEYVLIAVFGMMWLDNKNESFLNPYQALGKAFTSLKDKNPCSNDIQELLKSGARALCTNIDQNLIKNSFIKLDACEKNLLKDNNNLVSDEYYLLLSIRAKFYDILKDHNKQMTVLNRLLQLVGWTEGRQSLRFKKINEIKRMLYEKMHSKEAEEDLRRKQELMSPNISLDELMKIDRQFKLDFTDLSIELE